MNEMDKNGMISADSVLQKVPQEFKKDKVTEIINSCKDKKGKDNCETAFEQTKCISLKAIDEGSRLLSSN